jgi:hypothetical protein
MTDNEEADLKRRVTELEYALRQEAQINASLHNSLRDDFAKAALTGLFADTDNSGRQYSAMVNDAYSIADLMLEARKEK